MTNVWVKINEQSRRSVRSFFSAWLAASLVLLGFSADPAEAFTGGTISGEVVISKSQSPVRLTKKITIPEGQVLKIEPGVVIRVAHEDWAFQVGGKLILGGVGETTKITGNSKRFISIPDNQKSANVSIQNMEGVNLGETEVENGESFQVLDSTILGASTFTTSYSESPVLFERNRFYFSPRNENLGVNDSCKSFGIEIAFPFAPTKISSNSFSGGSRDFKDRQCASWLFVSHIAGRAAPVEFIDNSFNTLPTTIGWFPGGALMQGTYLVGSKTQRDLEEAVWDSEDDLRLDGGVTFESDRFTPIGSTPNFYSEPRAIRYRNCSALNRDYPGGVSRAFDSANKGARTRQVPFLDARLFDANKRLDADRDGIVCER